jgi:hypothetical protein
MPLSLLKKASSANNPLQLHDRWPWIYRYDEWRAIASEKEPQTSFQDNLSPVRDFLHRWSFGLWHYHVMKWSQAQCYPWFGFLGNENCCLSNIAQLVTWRTRTKIFAEMYQEGRSYLVLLRHYDLSIPKFPHGWNLLCSGHHIVTNLRFVLETEN